MLWNDKAPNLLQTKRGWYLCFTLETISFWDLLEPCQINGKTSESGEAEDGENRAVPAVGKAGRPWHIEGRLRTRAETDFRLRSYRRGEPTRTVLAILWNCQEDVQKTFIEWWAHRILNGLTPGTAFPIDNLGIWTADLLSGRTLYSLFKFRVSLEETGNKNKRAQRDELPHSFAYFHDVLFFSKQVRACHTPGPAITNSQKHSRVLSFST